MRNNMYVCRTTYKRYYVLDRLTARQSEHCLACHLAPPGVRDDGVPSLGGLARPRRHRQGYGLQDHEGSPGCGPS